MQCLSVLLFFKKDFEAKFQANVYNGCLDLLMMSMNLRSVKSTSSRYWAKLWQWHHHYDDDVIIETPGKNMKNFKYYAISLNMLHTGGLCGVLEFTASLIVIIFIPWTVHCVSQLHEQQ